jgi:hypothetical protein
MANAAKPCRAQIESVITIKHVVAAAPVIVDNADRMAHSVNSSNSEPKPYR